MTDPSPRPRDREATVRALVLAAQEVLAEEGFEGFGVNAVARRAGCDKQLIYRYFGGLEGVVDAVGTALAETLADALLEPQAPLATYRDLIAHLVLGLADLMRRETLLRRIAAWEIAGATPLGQRLTGARGRLLQRWMGRLRGDLVPPPGVDAPALNAALFAAAQHLVLAGDAAGEFAGVALATDADWARVKTALLALVDGAYAAPGFPAARK